MAVELKLDNIKWPKDFPELKALDDLLHCGICYGYIKTCMITSCSHNYCSLCIRKSIHYKTQCPTCFEEIYEPHLRNNRAFDQFVELFSGIRDKLLRHLRIADTQLSKQSDDPSIPRCIKFEQYSPILNGDIFKKSKGESSRLKHSSGALDLPKAVIDRPSVSRRLDTELVEVSPSSHNEALHTIPKMFLSPKKQADTVKPKQNIDVPMVPCPVCEVDIPERNINFHLDNCLVRSEKLVTKSPEKKKKRSPLSKMVYSMMSEKDLRKRLRDHGLNSHGDKKALINRIQRFTVLYNSECDSDDPRPIADIIRQIDKEDNGEKKNVGALLSQPRLPAINRKTDPKIIEEENKKYIEENKNSFNALINAVRLREGRHVPAPKRRFEKIVDSSSSDDDNPDIIEIPDGKKSTEIQPLELETSVNIHDGDHMLFDSSDDELSEEYPMSPVLKCTTTPLRNNSLTSKKNLSTKKDCSSPQLNKGKENKNMMPKINFLSKSATDKTVNGICETQVLCYDSDTSAPSPSCIEPEDDDNISSLSADSDTEDNDKINQDLDKATENSVEIKLKDSKINHPGLEDEKDYELSEEYPMSPVLKCTITPSKNNNLTSKENISSKKDLNSSQINKGKENKNLMSKIKLVSKPTTNKTVSGICETQVLCCDSDTSAPSPSCIVPEDDGNLSSLSADDDLEDDVLNFTSQDLDQATENYRLKDSQIDDPDFKIQDYDLDLEDSEDIFVPIRRSKRKLTTPPPAIKCNTPVSQSKRKAKTPTSSSTESSVSRTLRKRAKH